MKFSGHDTTITVQAQSQKSSVTYQSDACDPIFFLWNIPDSPASIE